MRTSANVEFQASRANEIPGLRKGPGSVVQEELGV